MKLWTPDELDSSYIRLLDGGVDFVVIGGQAVNLWSRQYCARTEELALRWGELEPFASYDLDLLGGRLEVEAAAKALTARARYFESVTELGAPNSGNVHAVVNGEELVVQFIYSPFGVRNDEVRRTAVPFRLNGRELLVMHPLVCLESKVECLLGLSQAGRQDLKHVRLSILCVREFLRDAVAMNQERLVLQTLERVYDLASGEHGMRVALDHGVVMLDAIDMETLGAASDSLSRIGRLMEKRLPELELRRQTRWERYQELRLRFERGSDAI